MKFLRQSKLKALLLLAAAVLFIMFLTYILGGEKTCYLKGVIGIPCPGCGLTRAMICLLQGNFKESFFYHPLLAAVALVFILAIFQKVSGSKSPIFDLIYIAITVLFIIVYIIRLFVYFPHTSPMDFNERSVLMKGFHFLIQGIKLMQG